ncbi:hypothetical protein CRE_19856 [Caenorhabditis remanei]|uniref:BTB domain-containing protein n=1 Tax=Caenorhabditis remanei TaxID=31234 RepID=E3MTA6_CAERE|nr:hypothetical protein CRE_19856 [Caenorhabditis remanei]
MYPLQLTSSTCVYENAFAQSDKTDAILVVEGKKLYVNKALLSYYSDYFKTLFDTDSGKKSPPEFTIPKVNFENFAKVLSLVQDDSIKINEGEDFQLLLELADRFQLPLSKRVLELVLIKFSKHENIFSQSDKTDAILNFDGKFLHVNKTLLSYHSAYFKSLFNGERKSGIDLEGANFEDFATLLSLVQNNPFGLTEGNAENVLMLVNRFLMPSAKRHVELFLILSSKNGLEKIRIADKYKLNELLEEGIKMLNSEEDFYYFPTDSTFQQFSDETKQKMFFRGIHHLVGDHEGAKKAIVSATRTTGVMAGGALGFLIAGPPGAVTVGMATGATLDGVATLASSQRENKYTSDRNWFIFLYILFLFRPEGSFAVWQNAIDHPSGGAVFDAFAGPVSDGLAGYQGGKIAGAFENAASANAAKAAEFRVKADRAMGIAEQMRETPGATSGQVLEQCNVAMGLDKQANLFENAGRPPPPVLDPKASGASSGPNVYTYMPEYVPESSSRPNVYPPEVPEDHRQRKRFRSSEETIDVHPGRQQYQRTEETTSTSTSIPTSEPPTFNFSANEQFLKELQKVITAFKSFDSLNRYDILVIESKVNQFLKGKGAQVIQTAKIFTKVMLKECEKQYFKTQHIVSVLYGKSTADKFGKNNPLQGLQVLLRHQSESMGALHILLSHPQDMLDILPGLDISLFPPHIRQFLVKDLANLSNGKKRSVLTETQKLAMVEAAKQYYIANPLERRKMMANELLLVAYLRVHMNPANFFVHQFFPVSSNGQQFRCVFPCIIKFHYRQFRVVFNMPTISGNQRRLSICLSCEQDGTSKAIIYKSPGKDGVDCDCYEIITSFLV